MLIKKGVDERVHGCVYIPIKKGKFEYVLNFDHEELYELIFEDEYRRSSWRSEEFISEQGVINFTLHPREHADKNIVEGGQINKEYLIYKNEASNKTNELEPFQSVQAKWMEITGVNFITSSTSDLYDQVRREDTTFQEWLLWKLEYAKEHPTIVGYCILLSEMMAYLRSINDFLPYASAFQTIFEPKFPDHPYTAQMINLFTRSSFTAGTPFIDFTAVDFNNNSVRLSERIAGKPAVLHLWASWCGPCRQKGRELIPVYEEFRDKGLVVIGVARERNIAAAQAAIQLDKYPWENLVELNDVEQIWNKYGIGNAGGSLFLIDANGNIIAIAPTIEEIRDFLLKKL